MNGLIDLGGTKVLAAIVDGEEIGSLIKRPTPKYGDVVGFLIDMLDQVSCGSDLDAIAMAVPGPFVREIPKLAAPQACRGHGGIWISRPL